MGRGLLGVRRACRDVPRLRLGDERTAASGHKRTVAKHLFAAPTWLRILTIQQRGGTSALFQKAGANKPTWSVPRVTRVWGIQQILLSTS